MVNNSLAAAEPTPPLLRQRAAGEIAEIGSITNKYSQRTDIVPMLAEEPVGEAALAALSKGIAPPRPSSQTTATMMHVVQH